MRDDFVYMYLSLKSNCDSGYNAWPSRNHKTWVGSTKLNIFYVHFMHVCGIESNRKLHFIARSTQSLKMRIKRLFYDNSEFKG